MSALVENYHQSIIANMAHIESALSARSCKLGASSGAYGDRPRGYAIESGRRIETSGALLHPPPLASVAECPGARFHTGSTK